MTCLHWTLRLSIAEFYSRNLANEVTKGMNEKVKDSDSVSRVPIGYLNTRVRENGRENRTVAVDEQRSPLITWAVGDDGLVGLPVLGHSSTSPEQRRPTARKFGKPRIGSQNYVK